MRIGKIELLANGLANEQHQAVAENKVSLFEHSKKLKVNNETVAEQLKYDLTQQDINDTFDDVRQVANTQNLLDSIEVPEIEPVEKADDTEPNKNVNLGNNIDSFFDN